MKNVKEMMKFILKGQIPFNSSCDNNANLYKSIQFRIAS